MVSGIPSAFHNGYWVWDNMRNTLAFLSRDITNAPSIGSVTFATAATKQIAAEVKFKETVGALDQIRFRRYFQRVCKPNEPEVITIQDAKDVALFIADASSLTPEFIKYFHIPTMDRFLRALIVYFQYYLQVWENLMYRREESKRKLWQPVVTELEDVVRDDLADLRSMVAREYCSVLIGIDDAQAYHHMNNKNNDSLSDKDRRLFEILMCITVRVVWVALQRKYLNLIELEMNRLLRTDAFNMSLHNGMPGGNAFATSNPERRVLRGPADLSERKLLQRSPAAKELIAANHDHRMLAIGVLEIDPADERQLYLEAAYAAPEEMLIDLKVTVGVLGIPRKELDAMLMPKERTSEDINKARRELPEFKLPPRVEHSDDEMPKAFPTKPCKYVETEQTAMARIKQRNVWRKHAEKAMSGTLHLPVSEPSGGGESYTIMTSTSRSASMRSDLPLIINIEEKQNQ